MNNYEALNCSLYKHIYLLYKQHGKVGSMGEIWLLQCDKLSLNSTFDHGLFQDRIPLVLDEFLSQKWLGQKSRLIIHKIERKNFELLSLPQTDNLIVNCAEPVKTEHFLGENST